jgi:hypothetical protein
MHCELVVPGLLSSPTGGRFPAIELLLARGRRTIEQPEPQRLEPWLHDAFELDEGPIPAGALSLIAANGDPGKDSWLRADPVHLRLMRDHLIVVPAEALSISRAEADAFCASLNGHFTGAMQVHPLDPRRWCARVEKGFSSKDASPLEDAGREAAPGDPLLNEIQMLLHAHPVNEAREARGEPPVNSLWLWGAGRAGKASSRWSSVLANEPIAMGLAMLARTRYRSLPASAAPWLEGAPEDGRHLVLLDALRAPAALGDIASYGRNLDALEAAWFAPLLRALRAGRIGMVTVHVPDAAASFETIRGDLRRFWRRRKALESYA